MSQNYASTRWHPWCICRLHHFFLSVPNTHTLPDHKQTAVGCFIWPFVGLTYTEHWSECSPRVSVCLIITQWRTQKSLFSKFIHALCSEALKQQLWLPREASRKPGLYPEAHSNHSQIGTELSDLALWPQVHHLISRAMIHFHLWKCSLLQGKFPLLEFFQ